MLQPHAAKLPKTKHAICILPVLLLLYSNSMYCEKRFIGSKKSP